MLRELAVFVNSGEGERPVCLQAEAEGRRKGLYTVLSLRCALLSGTSVYDAEPHILQ